MKANLSLKNPLWQTAERRAILDKVVQESAAELEAKIKQKVLASKPSGRIYRRGAITGRTTKRGLASGLRRTSKSRMAIGSRFHRASAKGQPFASETGATLNATRAQRTGPLKATVSNSQFHSKILDDPNKLDRPFFASTAQEFRTKFMENLAGAIREVKTT